MKTLAWQFLMQYHSIEQNSESFAHGNKFPTSVGVPFPWAEALLLEELHFSARQGPCGPQGLFGGLAENW